MKFEALALRQLADAVEAAELVERFFDDYCHSSPSGLSVDWREAGSCNGFPQARAEILIGVSEIWPKLVENARRRARRRVAEARRKLRAASK